MEVDCIKWWGHISKNGYGKVNVGVGRKFRQSEWSHRFAYMECFGDIPEGMEVMHTCNFKACVNPEHLKLGTHQDNLRMASRDGLMGRYDSNEVDEVTKLIEEGKTDLQISKSTGVNRTTVWRIRNGKRRSFQ